MASTISSELRSMRASALRSLASWPAQAVIIVAIVFGEMLGLTAIRLAFAGLAVWALRGPRHAIQSLSLVWIIGLLNPALIGAGLDDSLQRDRSVLLLKWAALLCAAGSCLLPMLARRQAVPTVVALFSLYVAVVGLAALAASPFPEISLTKLVGFWLGATTVLVGFHVTAHESRQHHEWFTAMAVALVCLNVPLLFLPSMYRSYDGLFRGLFAHPQFTGLVFATLLAWLGGRCLVERKLPLALVPAAIGAFLVLWRTGSRTALFALVLGLGLALLLRFFVARASLQIIAQVAMRPRIAAAAALVVAMAIASGTGIAQRLAGFVQKRSDFYGMRAEILTSRQYLIGHQWSHFLYQPIFGNGFGLPSNPNRLASAVRDPATGIALSVPTEKGFLPTAVLEETGLVGAFLLLWAVGNLTLRIVRTAHLPRLWVAATVGLANLGESVFFSFGGVGMFLWLMLAFAILPEPEQPGSRAVP